VLGRATSVQDDYNNRGYADPQEMAGIGEGHSTRGAEEDGEDGEDAEEEEDAETDDLDESFMPAPSKKRKRATRGDRKVSDVVQRWALKLGLLDAACFALCSCKRRTLVITSKAVECNDTAAVRNLSARRCIYELESR
jgi:hypothetical protein